MEQIFFSFIAGAKISFARKDDIATVATKGVFNLPYNVATKATTIFNLPYRIAAEVTAVSKGLIYKIKLFCIDLESA